MVLYHLGPGLLWSVFLISLIYVMTLCNDEFYRTKREAHSLLIEHRRLPTKLNSSL